MRRLALIATAALIALVAPTVAQADSFGFNYGQWPNGQFKNLGFNYSTGNRGGYPPAYYGGGVPVPTVIVPIQQRAPATTYIVTEPCIAGFTMIGGQCVRVRRIR